MTTESTTTAGTTHSRTTAMTTAATAADGVEAMAATTTEPRQSDARAAAPDGARSAARSCGGDVGALGAFFAPLAVLAVQVRAGGDPRSARLSRPRSGGCTSTTPPARSPPPGRPARPRRQRQGPGRRLGRPHSRRTGASPSTAAATCALGGAHDVASAARARRSASSTAPSPRPAWTAACGGGPTAATPTTCSTRRPAAGVDRPDRRHGARPDRARGGGAGEGRAAVRPDGRDGARRARRVLVHDCRRRERVGLARACGRAA